MTQVMLPVNPDAISQSFIIDLRPDGKAITLRVDLDYRAFIGKYFMSITNALTGEGILTNFPVVASEEDNLNDLLKQVHYKLCGSLVCYPVQKDLTYPDPNGTISEFELVWGDSLWMN